jgi:hypothetical protein
MPALFVCVREATLVSSLVMVSRTSGIKAPLRSVIVPDRVAAPVCADRHIGMKKRGARQQI